MDDHRGVTEHKSTLKCTLEELYNGCIKKFKVTRTVPADNFGNLKSIEELLEIDIKPGWKKGTEITFDGKGNHEPGAVAPANLTFVLDEKPHALFLREGNDLVVTHKISLLDTLVGKTINLTTLDGRDIGIKVDYIVKPGDVSVIRNEGMPIAKKPGKKGNLIIRFDVVLPSRLSRQQKIDLRRILHV